MEDFFNLNGGVMGFMSKVADVIVLSLLWFVCSIPIVTMGAATTALYYTAVKVIRRERSYIFRSFFSSFKENFMQGTFLWLLFLAVMSLLGINIRFSRGVMALGKGRIVGFALTAVYGFMGLFAVFTALYMLPVLSRFVLKKRQILMMSLLMSVRHLPYTLLMAVIVVLSVGSMLYAPVAVCFAPAAGALLYSLPMERLLKRYIKPEETDGYKDKWYLE